MAEFFQIGKVKVRPGIDPNELRDEVDLEKLNLALRKTFQKHDEHATAIAALENGYGEIYGSGLSKTVTITAADTSLPVDSDLQAGAISDRFKFEEFRRLRCQTAGTYLVSYSVSLRCATAAQEVSACVLKSGQVQSSSIARGYLATANQNIVLSGHCVLALSKNDYLELGLANHTGTNNLVVKYCSLSAFN